MSRVEKVIKRKGDKLYFKWKANSFNSWIDKKDIAYMSEYFIKPKPLRGIVKIKLKLNYIKIIHQNLPKRLI